SGQAERLLVHLAGGPPPHHRALLRLVAVAPRAVPGGGARVGLRPDSTFTAGVEAEQVAERGPEAVLDLAGHLVGDAVGGGVEFRLPGVVVLVEEARFFLPGLVGLLLGGVLVSLGLRLRA